MGAKDSSTLIFMVPEVGVSDISPDLLHAPMAAQTKIAHRSKLKQFFIFLLPKIVSVKQINLIKQTAFIYFSFSHLNLNKYYIRYLLNLAYHNFTHH